jgi:hypothetical protein
MSDVIWLSIDPVRKVINIYPKKISERIEKSYMERDNYIPCSCILGSDFFNATIHFHPSGNCYQTTQGISMGRAGFKQPGYRSVDRVKIENDKTHIKILSKKVHGEWRITFNENESEYVFNEKINKNLIVNINKINNENLSIDTWKPEDLDSNELDKNIIMWEWCKENSINNNGNNFTLPNKCWCPYDFNNTNIIENAYKNNLNTITSQSINISLPIIGERKILFEKDSCYGKQISLDNTKIRFIRRIVRTVKELNEMFTNIDAPTFDISSLLAALPDGNIPYHFNCCITQDIMNDPVKTIDGFIYDRTAILQWFEYNTTSPLSGLPLSSIVLESCDDLKQQIDYFKASLVK